MKNFRKVLALVLVVATLFSFTAMTSAAYKDADKISYEEAVNVLSAVGVLNGYEVAEDEFEFHPTDKITREEMAKMIAVMCNAGDDVSALYASACNFADVAKDRWSASYVAYCAKTGIVAGRSATTFDPKANVTGLETAKMLLVALGFEAEQQGYVGAEWKINVLRDAKQVGLLKGFAKDYNVEAAITREEAAQMMLNALKSNVVVGYLNDNATVVITNKLLASVEDQFGGLKWTLIDAKGNATLYGNVIISNDALGEALFGLEKGAATTDCYGRPGYFWTINGKNVVSVIDTPVWTSNNTTDTKINAALKDLGITKGAQYVDGHGAYVDGGIGAVVEIFENGTVVEINTYLGKVGQINYANGTFELLKYDGTVERAAALNDYGFTKEDEGKVVLYWTCNETGLLKDAKGDNIHDVVETEATTLKVHGVRNAAGNFCDTAEKTYYYATKAVTDATVTKEYIGKEVKVYTDLFGNVLAWAEVGAPSAVSVLVNGTATKTGVYWVEGVEKWTTYTAKMVDFAAAPAAVEYEIDLDTYLTAKADTTKSDILVRYEPTADGRVKAVAAGTELGAGTLAPNTPAFGANQKYLDNTTKILLRVWDHAEAKYEYKYFDGMDEIDGTYTLTNAQYICGKGAWVDYLYAEAKYVKSANLAYVLSEKTDEAYIGLKDENGVYVTYYLYNAIVNGEDAVVAFETELAAGFARNLFAAEYALINAETHDGQLIYKATTAATIAATTNFAVENGTLCYVEGAVLKGVPMAADATIFVMVYDVSDDAVTAVPVAQADVANYLLQHGYTQAGGYMHFTGAVVDTLYVFVEKA